VRRASILLLVLSLGAALSGCGGGEGAARGPSASVYVVAPLCSVVKRPRVVCLPAVVRDGRLDLARIGADARRATEDSTTIGYVEAFDPAANRFSRPILEGAGIVPTYRR
jgi:hypothetical protein